MFKAKNGLFPHPSLVWCTQTGEPLVFLHETYPTKTRLVYGENFLTIFD